MITQQRLLEVLDYSADTGVFVWRQWVGNCVTAGVVAGSICSSGHRQIKIDGRSYMAHRLAWLFSYGSWPVSQIDHINRCRDDNRIKNLREATRAENARNRLNATNISGHRGVYWNKNSKKWQASLRCGGRNRSLGYFSLIEDAIAARINGEATWFGEFSPVSSAAAPGVF